MLRSVTNTTSPPETRRELRTVRMISTVVIGHSSVSSLVRRRTGKPFLVQTLDVRRCVMTVSGSASSVPARVLTATHSARPSWCPLVSSRRLLFHLYRPPQCCLSCVPCSEHLSALPVFLPPPFRQGGLRNDSRCPSSRCRLRASVGSLLSGSHALPGWRYSEV